MRDQAVIDDAEAKIEAARAELRKAEQRFHRIYRAQEKRIKAEGAKEAMTVEYALTENIADRVSNEAGYDWLTDRCWKGAWKGLGLMVSGAWLHLNQRAMQFALKRIATDETLDKLCKVLEDELLPVMKPGGLYDPTGLLGRPNAKFKQFEHCKVFSILSEDCGESYNWYLIVRPDNTVEVTDLRRYTIEPMYKGNLRGALTVLRNNCYHSVD